MGCLFGEAREPWRDYDYRYDTYLAMEVNCGAESKRRPDYPPPGYYLEIAAYRSVGANGGSIYLTMRHLTGSGVYWLGKNVNGNSYLFFEDSNHNNQYASIANRLSFGRVTRFDTVAHVVSGTFEGYLDKPGSKNLLLLQHERFDSNYKVPYATRPRNAE